MISIRPATAADAPLLTALIRELAEYEHVAHEAAVSEEGVVRDGFGARPKFRAIIAEWDGQVSGYALFFEFYSSFQGCAGLLLDDIYVRPPFRRKGIGKALLAHIANVAIREDYFCIRMEVLDWNEPALGFFQQMDAAVLDDWRSMVLIGEPLQTIAGHAS